MKFIIKLLPEITIKIQSVRLLRFIKILTGNIRNILKECDESVAVVRHWDHIEVRIGNEHRRPQVADALTRIPGIHHILAVEERPWQDRICTIFTCKRWRCIATCLVGKSFCVRVETPRYARFHVPERRALRRWWFEPECG